MAYTRTITSTDAKTAFKKYMQQQSASYDAYLQSTASPQLSNATQTINSIIGAVNPGALPSGTAAEVANVLRTTANILNQTSIDYTNMSKDDISAVIKTTIGVFLTRDVFSDGKWVTYLSKLNSQLLGGVFSINSPLVKTVVGKLTSTVAKAITSGLTWDEAKTAANECSTLQSAIADGSVGSNLDKVTEELDEYDKEEIQDGISVAEATGGQMTHESVLPETPPEFKWGFYDKAEGNLIIEIDSYLSDDFTARSSVATFPLEKGSYQSYNKVNEGRTGTAVVARMAENTDIQAFHDKLEELRVSPQAFTIVSPNIVLNNMTVESFNFKRDNRTSCNELLIVNIVVKEIQDTSKAKAFSTETVADASNVTSQNNGNVGTKKKETGSSDSDSSSNSSDTESSVKVGDQVGGESSTKEPETPLDKVYEQVKDQVMGNKDYQGYYQQRLHAYNSNLKPWQTPATKLDPKTTPEAYAQFQDDVRGLLANVYPYSQIKLYQTYPQIREWTGGKLYGSHKYRDE